MSERFVLPAPFPIGSGLIAGDSKRGFAEYLRSNQTPSERLMARVLYHLGIDAEPQVLIRGWIVDFYDEAHQTVIEVDGSGHREAEQKAKDRHRDAVMRGHGYKVLRFSNYEIRHFMGNLFLNGWAVR